MATQQLNIKTLEEKTVNTQDGPKQQWIVNGTWKSWKGKWNGGWAAGGIAKGVFVTEQKGQYTNKNIKCPPELMPKSGGFSSELLKEIKEEVIAIHMMLSDHFGKDVPRALTASPEPQPEPEPEATEPESSDPTDEIDIESIPLT